jgi:hypothetical protein
MNDTDWTNILTALSWRARTLQDENDYSDAAAIWRTCAKVHRQLGETKSADDADDLAKRCELAATGRQLS